MAKKPASPIAALVNVLAAPAPAPAAPAAPAPAPAPAPAAPAAPIILPEVGAYAKEIAKAQAAIGKSSSKIAQIINQYLDACRAQGIEPTEQNSHAIKDAMAAALKSAFESAKVAASKTATEYAQGAGRAFYHGVPWEATTKNKPALKIGAPRKGEDGAVVEAPAKGARQASAKPDAKTADPMEVMGAPTTTKEGRDTVRDVAIGLQRWCNANVAKLDLATREVIEQFRASVEGLAK
jgi:hypothetical protein